MSDDRVFQVPLSAETVAKLREMRRLGHSQQDVLRYWELVSETRDALYQRAALAVDVSEGRPLKQRVATR